MSSKTLGNGTLGLRFMQNANRTKQLKEVEHKRADVQDDGKWEVSQAVKDAMGLKPADQTPSASSSDVHESSYLPFLFSDRPTASSSEPDAPGFGRAISTGRRVFKKGEEVSVAAAQEAEPSVPTPIAHPEDDLQSTKGRGNKSPLTRLSNASRSRAADSYHTARTSGPKSDFAKQAKGSLSAREAIFASSGAGTDLGHQRQLQSQRQPQDLPSKPVFMKPAGVDAPEDLQSPTQASTPNPSKRERVTSTAEPVQPKKKQKKSKRTVEE